MTNEIQKPNNIALFLEKQQKQIKRALPKHMSANRMARVALTECRNNPKLFKADPATLFGAFIQCAQLGLEPGGGLGHAYVIPFNNNNKGTVDVQLIIGYRGMIDLARRSGQVISIQAECVYQSDDFDFELGLNERLYHKPKLGTDRGPLIAVYAIAKLVGGGHQIQVLSKHDIERYKKMSKTSGFGPWKDHYDAMAKKTAIRQLFKYLPVSIEIQKAVQVDELGDTAQNQQLETWIDTEYEPLNEVEVVYEQPQQPTAEDYKKAKQGA